MYSQVRQVIGLACIFNILMPVLGKDKSKCEYYQAMVMGEEYYLYNEEYPENYPPSTSCLWTAESPQGTIIAITCHNIVLPTSDDCKNDRLRISLNGDKDFNDATDYCGKTAVTRLTNNNTLTVGLFASATSTGGKFVCAITAMQVGPPIAPTTGQSDYCHCGWQKEPEKKKKGKNTGVNEYPSMAALVDKDKYLAFCGATIIADKYAITAVHCVLGKKLSDFGLLVGDHDLSTGHETIASALHKIKTFVVHPQYSDVTKQNDLAILKTEKPILFSIDVGPVCLPFRYTWIDFYAQTVAGLVWKNISNNHSQTPQKVDLSVVANIFCSTQIPDPVIDEQICTYASGKDSCLGDSGGPIIWQDAQTKLLQLIGIISYGVGCAESKPAVNTRVTSYLSWIVSETKDAIYCIK